VGPAKAGTASVSKTATATGRNRIGGRRVTGKKPAALMGFLRRSLQAVVAGEFSIDKESRPMMRKSARIDSKCFASAHA